MEIGERGYSKEDGAGVPIKKGMEKSVTYQCIFKGKWDAMNQVVGRLGSSFGEKFTGYPAAILERKIQKLKQYRIFILQAGKVMH